MRMRATGRVVVGAVVVLLAAPLWPQERPIDVRPFDLVVRRSDGREFEGEIVEETDFRVELLTRGQRMRFNKEDVLRIERRVLPLEAYRNRQRLATFDAGRHADQLALGQWAARYPEDLAEQAIQHLVQATMLAPAAAEAYALLLPLFERTSLSTCTPAELDRRLGVYVRGLAGPAASVSMARRAADVLEQLGDPAGAIVLLEQSLTLPEAVRAAEPTEALAAEDRLVRMLAAAGRREEARALLTRILPSRAGSAARDLRVLEGHWLLEDCAAGAEDTCQELLAAVGPLMAGDDAGEAYLLRGSYHVLVGDLEAALADLAQAAGRGVMDARALLTYALCFARDGHFAKSQEALRQVRNVSAVAAHARLVEAYLLENLGEGEAALALLEDVVRQPSATWQAWLQYAQTLQRVRGESAGERLRPMLRSHQDNPVAFSEAALLLADEALRTGDGAGARRWLDYAGMAIGEDAEFYLRMGQAHLMPGGDARRARAALEQALELKADDHDVQNALAALEYRAGHLLRARDLFGGVTKAFSEEERKAADPPATLAYALRGLDQSERALTEELWTDAFDRQAGPKVLNNWVEEETYGIEIGIHEGGGAYLTGTQQFEDEGLTVLWREVPAERLSRVRVPLAVREGHRAATVGLRIEDAQGQTGLIFFRHPDGDLRFAFNRRGSESEVVRFPQRVQGAAESEDLSDRDPRKAYDMAFCEWPAGPESHTLEIRFDAGGSATLYLDDERVARRVEAAFLKGSVRIGISVMAPLGTRLAVEVQRVEIFRRRPAEAGNRRF